MKLMVIDGNSIVNRAFYGLPPLSNSKGVPTNAVYGFLTILSKMIDMEEPDGICVAFDLKGPTIRHKKYAEYKAQRRPMPEELAQQMPILKDVLDAMNIPRYELEGYEADDIIGTISRICDESGWDSVIVTGDRDDLQLVTDRVKVDLVITKGGKNITTEYTPDTFREEYGFEPKLMVDLKALMGDTSDNIPGVAGVGQKTASDLVVRFGQISDIYGNLNVLDIKDNVRKKLEVGRQLADMSYDLAAIMLDVPIDFKPEKNIKKEYNQTALYDIFKELEFFKLIEKYNLSTAGGQGETVDVKQWPTVEVLESKQADTLMETFKNAEFVSVVPLEDMDAFEVGVEDTVYAFRWSSLGDSYNPLLVKFFGSGIKKTGHNVKDLLRRLEEEGVQGKDFDFDTALAAYLLKPTDSAYELKELGAEYLGAYSGDTQTVFKLRVELTDRLESLQMLELYNTIELPLCEVLAEMEHRGFLADRGALNAFGKELGLWIDRLQEEIYTLAGEKFNINSPKQLGVILFDKLMLPPPKRTKTGYSTNIEVLQKLRNKHDIIEPIIAYREYTKLKGTYTDGLAKCIAPDGRIHTQFQMTVTATGRLSSTDPNLQNIPVRTDLGGEIRKMFVAAPGMVLVDADYSQIELRLLAHISGDKTMQDAFLSGEDIHTVTASQVFDVPLNEVTHLQRSRAKAVNFGIVYGISAFSLAQDIGVTNAEAALYIENYLRKYHSIRDYMKEIVDRAKKNGYVSTMFGRRRYLPELKSSNHNIRSFGERVALNMPIQGAAADIMKLAMINTARGLEREGLKARLVLQVHDELIAEAPENETERVKDILKREMEGVARLSVPLTADVHSGGSWYEAKQ